MHAFYTRHHKRGSAQPCFYQLVCACAGGGSFCVELVGVGYVERVVAVAAASPGLCAPYAGYRCSFCSHFSGVCCFIDCALNGCMMRYVGLASCCCASVCCLSTALILLCSIVCGGDSGKYSRLGDLSGWFCPIADPCRARKCGLWSCTCSAVSDISVLLEAKFWYNLWSKMLCYVLCFEW